MREWSIEPTLGGNRMLAERSRRDLRAAHQHFVHQPVLRRFLGAEEIVALSIALNGLDVLPGMARQDLVEPLPEVQDLFSVDLDVCGLPLKAAHGLMNHDTRVGQSIALTL